MFRPTTNRYHVGVIHTEFSRNMNSSKEKKGEEKEGFPYCKFNFSISA